MRLLCVEHKTIFGGGQVALLNALTEWQAQQAAIEPLVVCSRGAALASRARPYVPCIEMDLGAIDKTRGMLWNMARRVAPTRALCAIMREFRPQVTLANGAYSFLACLAAAKLAGVPAVWYEHNSVLPNGRMLRRLIRDARALIVVSATIQKQFSKLVPNATEKIHVVYNGVAVENFRADAAVARAVKLSFGWSETTRVVGTVSRLAPEKNVALFLTAAQNIARVMSEVKFLVVGDGPERDALQTRFQNESIVFTGQREDVSHLLQAMDVFALSSDTEGFPVAVVEAMAAARAIVATDVGGVREALSDDECGILIPPRDSDALTHAVSRLLRDDDARRVLGERACARATRYFTRAQQARKMQTILEHAR